MDTIKNMQIHGKNYEFKAKYDSDGNQINTTYSKKSELNSHILDNNNPHNVTKEQVGLENVDNTSDLDKPVSTAQQQAITAAKTESINAVGNYTINGKKINTNPSLVKGDIGLGNVDNTSDLNKPISTATQEALDNKANIISIISGGAGVVTQTIDPNKLYKFGEVSSLNITLGSEIPNIYNEYMFEFTSGDTPTVLTLPETVKWIGDSLVDNNKTYQVSIVNNIAVMGGA